MDTFPKPEACCGGALLHAALQHEFETAVIRPDWPVPANVRAAVTTREGPSPVRDSAYGFNVGTRCGDAPELVARNRAFLREALQLPTGPRWLRQVHGTRVVVLDSSHPGLSPHARKDTGGADGSDDATEPEADAALTRTSGIVLAVQTADCLPVLLCAGDGSEIAVAHAGWRGLCAGVLENTLAALHPSLDGVVAWLGPAIAARSYAVGAEVRDAFVACDPLAMSAFKPSRAHHWYCDLCQLARLRLRRAGVTRIFGGGFDTFTDLRLHSYRRDRLVSGRMVSLLWMAPTRPGAADSPPR